jgi:transposase InsO family protein
MTHQDPENATRLLLGDLTVHRDRFITELLRLAESRIARNVFRPRDQACGELFDYIKRAYNPTRRHSTLGYVSPIAFEQPREA